jgi:polysaccharide export outer membrane protein
MRRIASFFLSSSLWKTPLLCLMMALVEVGCGLTPPPPPQPMPPSQDALSPVSTEINNKLLSMSLQSAAEYHLGPEDLLQITLFNVPESEVSATPRKLEARVSQQGDISLPLLGDIPAAGLTTSALEQRLQERYKKYLRDPQVGVFVKEYHSQRVSVIGEVQKPGVFELSGPKTLIDLLAMAGGVSEKAGRQVYLFRQGPTGRESSAIDLYALANKIDGANPPVQAGDVINVPRAGMFFVDGAVRHPGPFSLNRPYTLTQALASAGGVDNEVAKTSNITIIRLHDSPDRETVAVNLDDILAGKAADPQIKAEDVIIVPTSTTKYLVKRFVGPLISGVPILPYGLFY